MNKMLVLASLLSLCISFSSCNKNDDVSTNIPIDENTSRPEKITIALFSDPHTFAPSLLINEGTAIEEYLSGDRKLLKESTAILDALTAEIIAKSPDLVMVPGDLTKDGAKVSHKLFATYCKKMEDAGIQVFVIPGNHDVNSEFAEAYNGDVTEQVASVTWTEFAEIYNDYGYGEAIATDPTSLSYVVEPIEGFRILSIDACKYSKTSEQAYQTSGVITDETLAFITEQATKAKEENATIFCMRHHGLIEHWIGQSTFMSEYLVDNWATASQTFIDLGIQVVFTGHFHAQDIVSKTSDGQTLFDIETGSTVTYPCPYRFATLTTNNLEIESFEVGDIDYDLNGQDLQTYAKAFITGGVSGMIAPLLEGAMSEGESTMPEDLKTDLMTYLYANNNELEYLISEALIAHYAGDEGKSKADRDNTDMGTIPAEYAARVTTFCNGLTTCSKDIYQPILTEYATMIQSLALSMWTDQAPYSDNEATIEAIKLMVAEE